MNTKYFLKLDVCKDRNALWQLWLKKKTRDRCDVATAHVARRTTLASEF